MIKSRTEILSQNQTLAEVIIRHQILRKQFDEDSNIEEEGVGLETFGRIISKAVKRNRELKDKPLRYLAGDDMYPFEQPVNKELIAEDIYISKQEDDDVRDMGNLLVVKEMQSLLGAKHLLVITDYVAPWLDQWNSYDELDKAIEFLKDQVSVHFDGGFELSGDDIIVYIPYLDTLAADLYMAFENSSTVMFICKYGNIHLKFHDESERALLTPFMESKGFSKVDECGESIDPEEFYRMLGKMIDAELGDEGE